MKYRKLTMEESFPLAFQKGLNKVQSEHFVNNVLAKGAIEKGYENFPMGISVETDLPSLIDSNPPQFLIGTYIKNHWRVILASLVVGGLIWYGIDSQIKKTNKQNRVVFN